MPEELAPRQWFATAPSPTCGGPLRRPVASSQEQQHCRQREQRARHKRRAPRRCPHASGLEALLIVHACYPCRQARPEDESSGWFPLARRPSAASCSPSEALERCVTRGDRFTPADRLQARIRAAAVAAARQEAASVPAPVGWLAGDTVACVAGLCFMPCPAPLLSALFPCPVPLFPAPLCGAAVSTP